MNGSAQWVLLGRRPRVPPPVPTLWALSGALTGGEPGRTDGLGQASCEPCVLSWRACAPSQRGLGPPFGIHLPFHKHRPGFFLARPRCSQLGDCAGSTRSRAT